MPVVNSYNIFYGLDAQTAVSAARRLIQNQPGSLIGFQEMFGDVRSDLFRQISGWGWYQPVIGNPGEPDLDTGNPVMWREPVWRPVDRGWKRLSEAQYVGPGAGGPRIKRKALTWVEVARRDNPRARRTFANVHLVPSIYEERRDQLHERQLGEIAEWVQRHTMPIVVGDWNATPDHANFRILRRLGMVCNFDQFRLGGGTHGTRKIDMAWYFPQDYRCTEARILTGYPSDHRPLVARLVPR